MTSASRTADLAVDNLSAGVPVVLVAPYTTVPRYRGCVRGDHRRHPVPAVTPWGVLTTYPRLDGDAVPDLSAVAVEPTSCGLGLSYQPLPAG